MRDSIQLGPLRVLQRKLALEIRGAVAALSRPLRYARRLYLIEWDNRMVPIQILALSPILLAALSIKA